MKTCPGEIWAPGRWGRERMAGAMGMTGVGAATPGGAVGRAQGGPERGAKEGREAQSEEYGEP